MLNPKLKYDSTIIYFIDECTIVNNIVLLILWLLCGWHNENEILLLAPIGFVSTKIPDIL